MISAFSWEHTIAVERHREGTTLQVAEDFSLCHSERSLRSEESLFLGFAAPLGAVMREGTTLVVP
jgi:hypothetical protein